MKFNKDDIYATAATVVLHLIVLFLLSFGVLSTIVPEEERFLTVFVDESLDETASLSAPVNPTITTQRTSPSRATTSPSSTRTTTPARTTTTPSRTSTSPRPTTPNPEKTSDEKPITQDKEESVSVPDNSKKAETTVDNEQAQREAERKQREEQAEGIANATDAAFQRSRNQADNSGVSSAGTSPQGNPSTSAGVGTSPGSAIAGSFNLDGRSISGGGLPAPGYTGQDVGKIVINITVDPNGKVISADIGRGTNITDSDMRKSALDAAEKARFNIIQRPDNQSGTITYIYKLK